MEPPFHIHMIFEVLEKIQAPLQVFYCSNHPLPALIHTYTLKCTHTYTHVRTHTHTPPVFLLAWLQSSQVALSSCINNCLWQKLIAVTRGDWQLLCSWHLQAVEEDVLSLSSDLIAFWFKKEIGNLVKEASFHASLLRIMFYWGVTPHCSVDYWVQCRQQCDVHRD